MSTYEAFILVFTGMTFVIGIIKLMIALIDVFLKRK